MNERLIDHLRTLTPSPVLDTRGMWLYCRNARTGTTSIGEGPLKRRSLVRRRDVQKWEDEWRDTYSPSISDIKLFTFVRNPWDRTCSAFYHCRDRARNPKNQIDKKWEFTDWVKEVLSRKGPSVNYHFSLQYPSAYFDGEEMGFTGRFETLKEDWGRLAPQLNVSSNIPHWNASDHGSYVDHYDEETKGIIGELYQRDVRAFDYEFGK